MSRQDETAPVPSATGAGFETLPATKASPSPTSGDPLADGAPESFGDYDLLEEIGRGGMGVVWKARQLSLNRLVALKLIKPGMDSGQVLARFDAERQALALMDHPNIARVIDAGTTPDGWPFFVMELVEGVPILRFCDDRRLNIRERLQLFIPVCQAIQHAHQKGVIHRDIKPGNVLVAQPDGQPVPKVIDFGIAKAIGPRLTRETVATEIGVLLGTLEYMSPEQASFSTVDIDTRSDIYSLGILLYELLTGTTPFDRKTLRQAAFDEFLRRIREEEPPKPSTRLKMELQRALEGNGETEKRGDGAAAESPSPLPLFSSAPFRPLSREQLQEQRKRIDWLRGDLDWIVMKALDKDRNRRYETASGLATDIQRHLNNEPVAARPPGNLYRFQKLVRRNKIAFSAACAVLASLVVGLGLSSWLFLKERDVRQRAVAAEQKQSVLRQQAQAEASKSKQVAEFLTRMLQGVAPSVARGHDTTMLRTILDATAQRVSSDLTNQPLVEAELLSTLGRVYGELRESEKAEAMHRRALALRRQFLGEMHLETACSLNYLYSAIVRRGKVAEAEALIREAIAIQKKLLGNEHLDLAASLINLANALSIQRRYDQAEPLYREALVMQRKLAGAEDADAALSLNGLANLLSLQGKSAEAEPLLREALAIRRKVAGDDDPDAAKLQMLLGTTLQEQGKLEEAEAVIRQSLARQQKLLGNSHSEVAFTRYTLADLLWSRGQRVEAQSLLREMLAVINQRSAGTEWHAQILDKLAGWLLADENFTEAESLLRQCVSILEKKQPGRSPVFEAQSLLGWALAGQKKYAEAEQLLLPAYEGLKKRETDQPSPSRARAVKAAGERVVQLYERWGHPDQAAAWQKKLAELPAIPHAQTPASPRDSSAPN